MLSLNKLYKNRKLSLTIHCKCKYFDSTVQRAEDRQQKFYFSRLPFAVNVKLNLPNFVCMFTRRKAYPSKGVIIAGGQKITRVYKQNFTSRVTLQSGTTY